MLKSEPAIAHGIPKPAEKAGDESLSWVTPDDFLVKLAPADPGQRLAAFLIDVFILSLVTILIVVGLVVAASVTAFVSEDAANVMLAVMLLIHFFLWNGYWVWFEWRWMGMTPGKRMVGVQVIRPDHGQLTLSSVVARNLAREVEVWIPLRLLIFKEMAAAGGQSVFIWTFLLLLIPLFDRKRRRLGDFISGTCVVNRPPLPDLERDIAAPAPSAAQGGERWQFTLPMLEIYGTAQLNALQEVLTSTDRGDTGGWRTLVDIKKNVVNKIRFAGAVQDEESREFLLSFYKAMRAYLEGQLASGRSTIKTLKKSSSTAKGKTKWVKRFEAPE